MFQSCFRLFSTYDCPAEIVVGATWRNGRHKISGTKSTDYYILYYKHPLKNSSPLSLAQRKRRPAFRKCHVAGICVLLWRPLWASHGEHCFPSAPGTSLQFWSQINRSAMFYKGRPWAQQKKQGNNQNQWCNRFKKDSTTCMVYSF